MKLHSAARWVGMLGLTSVLGCKGLDVENPNAPDATRAFADPGAIAGLISGGFKSWFNAHSGFDSALLLNHMADGLTSSWNNFNIRYYASEGNECPVRCGWDNRPTSSYRFEMETYWYGYNGAASGAIDALAAIRNNHVVIGSAANTKVIEVGAQMLLAMATAQIALNYDQGFVLDENIPRDGNGVPQVQLVGRLSLRTAALAAFEKAITLARATTNFTAPAEWFGKTSQPTYTRNDLVKVMRTMQAEVLAYYPRNGSENAQVPWQQVATYASEGLSNGGVDWGFFHDSGEFFDGTKQWGNDITTTRVDTRVARLITDGPDGEASRHKDPWPEATDGNGQPNAFDHRVGNGTWGEDDDFLGVGTLPWDGGEGTDFAYASAAIFRPARGQYHQSNLGAIRYSFLAYPGYGLPGEDGTGFAPQYTPTVNDLLWAEALIETGSLAQGAALINNTRVARGNLPAATAGQGKAALLTALRYEQDVELFTFAANNYYNRRRIDGLKAMTPRQMPVPAKELQVLQKEIYTFGGPANPAGLAPPVDGQGRQIRNVRDIWAEMETNMKQQARRRNRN